MEKEKYYNFTDKQIEEFKNHLKHVQAPMDCCNNPKINVLKEVFLIPFYGEQLTNKGLDSFVTICNNCYKINQYSVKSVK